MPSIQPDRLREMRAARIAETVVAVATGLAASLFAQQALRRFYTLHNHTFDLAMYARLAHGMAEGDFHTSLLDLSFFAAHTPLLLLPLGLLGRVLGTVPVLLVAQAACVALPALSLFRLGLRERGPLLGVAAALAYLLYPNLSHVASYEFHPGNLALPLIAMALSALHGGRGHTVFVCCLGIVACRADFALITAMVGVLAWFTGRRPLGAPLMLGSAVYMGLTMLGQALTAGPGVTSMDLHFGPWGGAPWGIVGALVRDPEQVLSHLSEPSRLTYLPRVLAPLLLLPLLAPRYLLPALPVLAINLVSVFPTTTELYSHYLTPAVPVLAVAAVLGVQRLGAATRWAVPGLLGAALLGQWLSGGAPFSRAYVADDFRADGQTRVRAAVLSAIPPRASVQAPDSLLPHLAERAVVHRAPPPDRGTDVVVLDLSHRARYAGTDTLLRTAEEPVIRNWLARTDYGLVAAYPGYAVLVRGQNPRGGFAARHFSLPLLAQGSRARLSSCLDLLGVEVIKGGIALLLHARGPCPNDLAVRLRGPDGIERVDLLFEGLLSPAHLRTGDVLRSTHPWSLVGYGAAFQVGLLRSSGARPSPEDPTFVQVVVGR